MVLGAPRGETELLFTLTNDEPMLTNASSDVKWQVSPVYRRQTGPKPRQRRPPAQRSGVDFEPSGGLRFALHPGVRALVRAFAVLG